MPRNPSSPSSRVSSAPARTLWNCASPRQPSTPPCASPSRPGPSRTPRTTPPPASRSAASANSPPDCACGTRQRPDDARSTPQEGGDASHSVRTRLTSAGREPPRPVAASGTTGPAGFATGYRVHMPTRAELRRTRRIDRWMKILLPGVIRRMISGAVSQPGWLPRRRLTLVSGDVDLNAGIGAVWLVWRPGSAKAETHTALIEYCGEKWQHTGGGSTSGGDLAAERLAAGRPGQVGMIELDGGAGALSYAYRLQHRHPDFIGTAPWIGSNELRVAAEVDHLLLGDRRIDVPRDGRLIVVWKSPSRGRAGIRPLIVAVGRDGSELSRIGPHDSTDSHTRARLSGQEE